MAEYIETHDLYDFADQSKAQHILYRFIFNLFARLGYEVKIEIMDVFQKGERKIKATYEPIADVAPVRHGRWIYDCERMAEDGWTYRQHHCSLCEFQSIAVSHYNYCPNCGAKMDGEK